MEKHHFYSRDAVEMVLQVFDSRLQSLGHPSLSSWMPPVLWYAVLCFALLGSAWLGYAMLGSALLSFAD